MPRRATMTRPGFIRSAQSMSGTRRVAGERRGPVGPPDAAERRLGPLPGAGRSGRGASTQRKLTAGSRPVRARRLRRAAARILALPPALLAAAAFAILVGAVYEDFSFAANGVKAPTGRKPEAAKLWVTDGTWFGAMFRPTRDAYTINRFDPATQQWIDTGTIIDDRNVSRADVIWDGTHLYAISGGTDPASDKHAAVLDRFSYDAATRSFSMDRGFPIR